MSGVFSFTNSMNSLILFNKQSTFVYITAICNVGASCAIYRDMSNVSVSGVRLPGFPFYYLQIPYYQICLPLGHPPEQLNLTKC